MSATVTRTNLADLITFCERIPFQRATPGSLWERVAESTPNVLAPQYSLRLLDATLNAYIRAGSTTPAPYKARYLSRECADGKRRTGVIRANLDGHRWERVK